MKIHITRDWLQEQGACDLGLAEFEAEFPTGLEIDLHDRDQVVHLLRTSECFRTQNGWLCDLLGRKGLDLREADLVGARLFRCDLAYSDLVGARLTCAYLAEVYLYRADLTRASLAGADLTRACLGDADLAGANLHRADLTRAHLVGAKLTGADLTRARIRRSDIVRSRQDPTIFSTCVIEEDV